MTKPCTVLRQKCHKVPTHAYADGNRWIIRDHSEAYWSKILGTLMYIFGFVFFGTDQIWSDTSCDEPFIFSMLWWCMVQGWLAESTNHFVQWCAVIRLHDWTARNAWDACKPLTPYQNTAERLEILGCLQWHTMIAVPSYVTYCYLHMSAKGRTATRWGCSNLPDMMKKSNFKGKEGMIAFARPWVVLQHLHIANKFWVHGSKGATLA